jgi:mRNA interferase MazF
MICEPWSVVVVPFPFSERREVKRRPALVLSRKRFNTKGHTILAMITTTSHSPWPGDINIDTLEPTGLRVSCLVRLKLFTLDNRLVLKKVGKLARGDRQRTSSSLGQDLVGLAGFNLEV